MDLGIAGKRALVCASSKGLGKGCAMALVREGVHVTMNGRTRETLEAAADEARALGGGDVATVCCDITSEEGRAEALAVAGDLDILVNNAGGPPPGDFRDWGREDWLSALNANMLTPIELIKASVDAMGERGFGRIVNITSSSVKSPIPTLGLSTARARDSRDSWPALPARWPPRASPSTASCPVPSTRIACVPVCATSPSRRDGTSRRSSKSARNPTRRAATDRRTSSVPCALFYAAHTRATSTVKTSSSTPVPCKGPAGCGAR